MDCWTRGAGGTAVAASARCGFVGQGMESLPAAGVCFPAQVAMVAFGLLVVQKV